MVQKGTYLNVIDNSGAKISYCINNVTNPTSRYAYIGDLLLLTIKKLRVKRRYASKIKKGVLAYGLIVRAKHFKNFFFGDFLKFYENSVILFFNKTTTLVGNRVFGALPRTFRHTHYLKILTLCAGTTF